MKKIFGLAVAFSFVASWAVAAPVESRFDVKLGGYIKLDAIHQDAAVGALGGELGTLGVVPSRAAEETDQSVFTARQSRLNFIITGPEFLGAKSRAFLEGDFYGPGGSNASGNLRMRHANFTLAWENTEVMFGQFWDIFGPMAPSTLDFGTGNNIGAPNNPRVAQARLTHKLHLNENNSLMFIVGLQNPQQDFEENTVGNIAGQVVYTSKALGVSPGYWGLPMQPLTVSLFGLYGQAETDDEDYDTWGAGIFTHLPILKSRDGKSRAMTLSFEGQALIAEGMDWNGATAHRAIGTGAQLEAAEGYGAFGQLIFYPIQPFGIAAGYGRRGILDTSNYRTTMTAEQFDANNQRYNDAWFVNASQDFGNFRLAVEYMRLEGKYLDPANDGEANRFQFSAIYFF